jgi:hypothetical protein
LRITGKPLEDAILRKLNRCGDKIGGWPRWVQEPEPAAHGDRFVLQIDSAGGALPLGLAEVGDGGVGYLFRTSGSKPLFRWSFQCL